MALTVRGESSTASNTAALSLTTPAGTQVGDLLVLIHCDDFYTAAGLTTPTGAAATTWTLRHTYDGGTDANHAKVWTAPATSAGANTVTPNSSTTDQERYAQLVVIAGAAFDQASSTAVTTNTSWVSPALTATGPDDILISTVWAGSASTNYTMAASMTATTEQDLAGGTGTGRSAYEQLSAAGSTGTRTHTSIDARTGVVVSVAIQASGGAVTPNPRQPIVESAVAPPRALTAGRIVQVNSVRFSNAAAAAARQIPRSPVTVVTAQPAKQRLVGGTVTPQRIPVPQVAYQGGTSGLGLAGTGTQVGSVLPASRTIVATAQPARQRLAGGATVPVRTAQQPVVVGTPELGTSTLGLATTAIQAKVGVEVGTAATGLAATGTAAKVVACGGSAALGLAASGSAVKKTAQTGSSSVGLAGTGVDKKAAPGAGTAALGAAGTGTQTGSVLPTSRVIVTTAPPARQRLVGGVRIPRPTSLPAVTTPEQGAAVVGLTATGVQAKTAVERGTSATGLATAGTAMKVVAVAGTTALGLVGRHSGTVSRAVTGTTGLGLAGTGVGKKVGVERGTAALGAATTGAAARKQAQAGRSALGLSGIQSGAVARALQGAAALGLATSGTEKKVAVVAGTAALGLSGRGGALTKKVAPAGTAVLGVVGRGAVAKKVASLGAVTLGLSGDGSGRKAAPARGTTTLGLSGDSSTVYILTFWPKPGSVTDLADRHAAGTAVDVADRESIGTVADLAAHNTTRTITDLTVEPTAGTIADTAARYTAGAPVG